MSSLRLRLAQAALALGLFALAFHSALSSSVILTRRDALLLYLPLKSFISEELHAGRLPLWDPYDGVGASVVGSMVPGLFHPGTLLLLLLPAAQALKWQVLLSYPFAALGMGLLARELGASAPGRWLAALGYALSGYLLSMSDNLPYLLSASTLPWVLLAAERLGRSPGAGRAVALAGALALSLAGGDAQALPFQAGAALCALASHGRVGARERLAWFTLALTLLVLLALPLLPPALAVARETGRTAGIPERVRYAWSLHPGRLFELIWGPPYSPELAANYQLATRYLGGYLSNFWAVQVPLGASVVLAALYAPLRTRAGALYGGGALVGLALALGPRAGLLPLLTWLAPPLAGFRYPEKLLPFALLGLCALAALGAERLFAPEQRTRRLWAFGALSLGLALWASPGRMAGLLDAAMEPELADALAEGVRRQALLGAGLVLALLAARRTGAGARGAPQGPLTLAWALPVLAFAQALGWVSAALAAGPASVVEQGSPLAEKASGAGRLCWYVDDVGPELAEEGLARAQVYTIFSATNSLWHLGSLRGYMPGYPVTFHELCPQKAGCPTTCSRRLGAGAGLLDAARYQPAEGLRELVRDAKAGTVLFADPAARQLASVVGERHAPDEAAARLLFADPAVPTSQAILVGPGEDRPAPGGTAAAKRPEPGRVEVEARLEAPGLVLVAEGCSQGWRAWLDDQPAELLSADLGLCAVRAPAGAHRLLLRYRPPGWPWAWLGPALALATSTALLRRRGRRC